jgi:hypothetical protein
MEFQNGIPKWNSKMEFQNGIPKWNSEMEFQNGTLTKIKITFSMGLLCNSDNEWCR